MKKLFFLIGVLFLFSTTVEAQNWYRNYEKYWWYRYRLVNDFMKVGPNAGESIPAYKRVRGYEFSQPVDIGYLHWGDATQTLGHYIAATALEYKILYNNGWNVNRSVLENYYAQRAFERVDKYAESYCNDIEGTYPNNPNFSNLNGFFVRDDVPGNFVYDGNPNSYNYKHFNRPKMLAKIPVGNSAVPYWIGGNASNTACYGGYNMNLPGGVISDYSGRKRVGDAYNGGTYWDALYCPPSSVPGGLGSPPRYPVEESQDQAAEVFVGMALSAQYMGNATFQGNSLADMAIDNAYRIGSWIGSGPAPWVIKNPLTNHCVYGIAPDKYYSVTGCIDAGAVAIAAAPAIAKATNVVSGSVYNTSSLQATAFNHMALFQSIQSYAGEHALFQDNYVAFSNNWVGALSPFLPLPSNSSWKMIKNHAVNNGHQTPHIPLIYKLNYPNVSWTAWPAYNPSPSTLALLNSSVFCGNYSYNDNGTDFGTYEWSTQDRLGFAHQRGTDNNADFNGVDYLELFNLYVLETGNYLQWIINPYYHENFSIDYPDLNGYGSHTNQLTLNYLEYLSLINHINSNGKVTFRGAKVVEMLPGFQTDLGSVFTAYVEDYDCEVNNEYHYASAGPNNSYIEYNPMGVSYQNKTAPIDENFQEDSVGNVPYPVELDSHYLDFLIDDVKKSGDYEIASSLYPDIFKGESPRSVSMDDIGKISIIPNPNNGIFTISFPASGVFRVKISNIVGKVVYEILTGDTDRVDIRLTGLTPGNYIVEATSGNSHYVQKVVIAN